MSTPLGHALLGATVGLGARGADLDRRGAVAVAAAAGVSPDLDFLPGLLTSDPARFHHLWSHSIAAGVGLALLVWLLAPNGTFRLSIVVFLAYLSHLVLDWLTFDPSAPVGIQVFWPLSDQFYAASHPLLDRVIHSSGNPLNLHNLKLVARELLCFGLPALALFILGTRRTALERSAPPPS